MSECKNSLEKNIQKYKYKRTMNAIHQPLGIKYLYMGWYAFKTNQSTSLNKEYFD